MEFNITDLLDDYQDSSVPIREMQVASANRIKEMTMKKINSEHKEARKDKPALRRFILIAAVIMALATTVMAQTGFRFTDWFSSSMVGKDYNHDVILGSGSMCWHVGDRIIDLSAQKATPTGAVIACDDISPRESNDLTSGTDYWLEQWEDGQYKMMEAKMPLTDMERTIPTVETTAWEINWEEEYGELTDGHYRIGMTFTGTKTNGEPEEVTCYAKFRIYQEEMGDAIAKCQDAMEVLYSRDSYHTAFYWYGWEEAEFSVIVDETWKSGDDFLNYHAWHGLYEESPRISGKMVRDGTAYGLQWEKADPKSDITEWKMLFFDAAYDSVDWDWMLDPSGATTGEVFVNGNVITVLKSAGCAGVAQTELTFTFDDKGNLRSIVRKNLPLADCAEEEKILEYVLEVHDTRPSECARMIDSQILKVCSTFSWVEDQMTNPEAIRSGFVNTDSDPIKDPLMAAELAKQETNMVTDITESTGLYYHTVIVSYDADARMWRVEFTFPQNEKNYQAIYLNQDGITQMIVDRTGTK